MKRAIVYDWIDKWGGAERILISLFDAFPEADIYTLYADYGRAQWANKYRSRISTTFLDSWYRYLPRKKFLTPFMPHAIESLNLSGYDTVLSVTSSFAKGVLTRPETKHVSYIFTPTRFLWHEQELYPGPGLMRSWLQDWDKIAAQRPDTRVTLSKHTQKLINSVYELPSVVLYPPFDVTYYEKVRRTSKRPSKVLPDKYFLFVGRLEPYKRVNLLISAFATLPNHNLVIVGHGSEKFRLQLLARGMRNISFADNLSEEELAFTYQHAQATIMPQSEDFGYTALESLFFGTPVISLKNSGAAEIIGNTNNGRLFDAQTSEVIRSNVEKFKSADYNVDTGIAHKFAREVFLKKIKLQLDH